MTAPFPLKCSHCGHDKFEFSIGGAYWEGIITEEHAGQIEAHADCKNCGRRLNVLYKAEKVERGER